MKASVEGLVPPYQSSAYFGAPSRKNPPGVVDLGIHKCLALPALLLVSPCRAADRHVTRGGATVPNEGEVCEAGRHRSPPAAEPKTPHSAALNYGAAFQAALLVTSTTSGIG